MCMCNVILALSAPIEGSYNLYKLTGGPLPLRKEISPFFIIANVPKQSES